MSKRDTHPIMLRRRQLAPLQEKTIKKLIAEKGNLLQVELIAKFAIQNNEVVLIDSMGDIWEKKV